ncbi:MAG: isopentenyl phosphate kinase [Candidatus Thorarchaeota archaeon]
MKHLTIVKLGGSVITHKASSPPEVNEKNLTRIVKELKEHRGELIIILGGGAHGHQAAHSHGFADPKSPKELLLKGVPPIRHNMAILSSSVETSLNKEGIPAIVLSPFSSVTLKGGLIHTYPTEIIKKSLDNGLVVVTHGDVCFDEESTVSILSGDTIAVYLAEQMNAKSILIGTDVDGVMDDNPKLNPSAKHIPEINQDNMAVILSITGPSTNTDVTGGMSKKLSELLEIAKQDREIIIFNLTVPNRLKSLLKNESTICTRIQS